MSSADSNNSYDENNANNNINTSTISSVGNNSAAIITMADSCCSVSQEQKEHDDNCQEEEEEEGLDPNSVDYFHHHTNKDDENNNSMSILSSNNRNDNHKDHQDEVLNNDHENTATSRNNNTNPHHNQNYKGNGNSDSRNNNNHSEEVGLPSSSNEEETSEEEHRNKRSTSTKYEMKVAADAPLTDRLWEVFTTFWPLGLIAFGGPQAHVAVLRDHLVIQRDWLDEEQFIELFAIGQGLPGPTSTQLVISAATSRAGPAGGILAFMLWNLPGFVALTICGLLIEAYIDPNNPPWYLIGLPPAAISLVFVAFYNFAVRLEYPLGIVLALLTCIIAILINNDERISPQSSQYMFPATLAFGGFVTWIDSKRTKPFSDYTSRCKGWDRDSDETMKRIGIPLWVGASLLLIWLVILVGSIVLVSVFDMKNEYLEIFEIMYRIGSLIYGGGQVVLPMLQDEVVPAWMTKNQFLQGLGLAQSMPGPLFNFSAYLGAVHKGLPGALMAFIGMFGPGVILIFAVVPFWARLRHNRTFRSILSGVNASAVGLVGATCVILWETAISTSADAIVFSVALTLNVAFGVAAPICVIVGGVAGAVLHPDSLDYGQVPYCIDQGYKEPE